MKNYQKRAIKLAGSILADMDRHRTSPQMGPVNKPVYEASFASLLFKQPRCQLKMEQSSCPYSKGDNHPYSRCLAPLDNDCRQRNTEWI